MSIVDGFPPQLLAQPAAIRLAYFQSKVVAHPRLKEVHEALLQAISQPANASLIFVFGPTGVGKTTLRLRVEQQLLQEALPNLAEDPGCRPVVALEAVAPESGNFNWKEYYTRALIALDEPLLAHKCDYGVPGVYHDDSGHLVIAQGVIIARLRRALEHCLRHRRPLALIIDEAQHFQKMASSRRLLDQMDTIKSLAGMTGAVHVLVGTYELLTLTDLSAQLSRRSIDIHFPRYRAECVEDVTAFKSVLLTFQRHLPLPEETELVSRYDYFYERSVGCVGILKNWLDRTLSAALADNQTTLTHSYLDQFALPTRKLLRIAREIQVGEAALLARAEARAELRHLLGMEPEPAAANRARPGPTRPRQAGRLGQRQPKRDPVGTNGREP